MVVEYVLIVFLELLGRWWMVVLILVMIFLCGMLVGVGVNLGFFFKRDCFFGKSGFLERFII